MINKLHRWDIQLSRKLLLKNEKVILRKIASFLAHSGDSWYIEIMLVLVWLFSDGRTHTIAAFFAGAVIIQALFVITIKFLIKRPRPKGDWGDVYRSTDPHSFPSGHAARAMMLAFLAFGFSMPIFGLLIIFWGISLSLARVALGVHYLSDILVGWMIGIILGFVILHFQQFFFNLIPAVF